jgi:hypothetical protein
MTWGVHAVHCRLVRYPDRLAGLVDKHDLFPGLPPPTSGVGGVEQRVSDVWHAPSLPTPFAPPAIARRGRGKRRHAGIP